MELLNRKKWEKLLIIHCNFH